MQNIGEEISGEYLKIVKGCDFIEYNLQTPDVQGEIDVVGIDVKKKELYEENKISFSEYLEYFGYLSLYRFRFLSLNSDDIEKAIFGDEQIKIVNPENIRKFNFPLTLSEEYGVPFQSAFKLVGIFFLKMLKDHSVTLTIIERIFIEVIETFPTEMDKKEFGEKLLGTCFWTIENKNSNSILNLNNQMIYDKFEKLSQTLKIYGCGGKVWIPETD